MIIFSITMPRTQAILRCAIICDPVFPSWSSDPNVLWRKITILTTGWYPHTIKNLVGKYLRIYNFLYLGYLPSLMDNVELSARIHQTAGRYPQATYFISIMWKLSTFLVFGSNSFAFSKSAKDSLNLCNSNLAWARLSKA